MCIRDRLYTVLTNKEAHGGKGSMIAIIKGTDVHTVTSVPVSYTHLDVYKRQVYRQIRINPSHS